jgi:hypothetical protein
MMEALYSSEMSVLTKAMWHNIPEDGILQNAYKLVIKNTAGRKVEVVLVVKVVEVKVRVR